MSATIPRFLLPRGYLLSSSRLPRLVKEPQIPYRTLPICRNASASTSKPRVLEKPTRFNPPSHGKRLKQQIPRQYGPQLTGEQKTEQRTKKYPNMMPAEGTFMHWFLTSRRIHIFISLVRIEPNSYLCLQCIGSFLSIYNTKITPIGSPCPPRLYHRLRKLAPCHCFPGTIARSC